MHIWADEEKTAQGRGSQNVNMELYNQKNAIKVMMQALQIF